MTTPGADATPRCCAALLVLAVASGAVVTVLACGKPAAGGGDGGMNPAGSPIVLGASIGITGGLSGNTRALKGAIAVATQQINAAGGVLGRQVQFVIEDDQSDPTYASMTAIPSLLGAGAAAVLGPGASSEVTAVMPILAQSQVVEVSATATSILLTQAQTSQTPGWFFRTVPNDSYQGKALVRFAIQGPNPDGGVAGCRKMAIVYNSDAYGMPMDAIIEPGMMAQGGSIVASIQVPATTAASYMTQAQQIVGVHPDCMAMVVFASTGAQLIRDLRTQIAADSTHDWSKFFIVGTDGCFDPSFIVDGRQDPNNPMSPSVVEGVYGTNADTAPPTPEYSALQSLYMTQIGYQSDQTDMDPYTSNEYDAAVLVALAIQQAGSLADPLKIRDSMFAVSRGATPTPSVFGPSQVAEALAAIAQGQDVNYNGASGHVDFTPSGDVVADFIVWQVSGGQFVTHSRIPAAQLEN